MSFAPGKFERCSQCQSTALTTSRESFDLRDRVFVGEQQCDDCSALYLYSRRPTKDEAAEMKRAKKKAPKTKPTAARRAKSIRSTSRTNGSGTRITVHKGRESTSMEVAPAEIPVGEAMRQAREALGDAIVDDKLAPGQMRQLAEAIEHVEEEKAAFNAKAEAAKIAKKALEASTEHLLGLVKEFTHPKPLPLFDQKAEESAMGDMLDAGNAETAGEAAPF